MNMKPILKWLDEWLYIYLAENVDIMPARLCKLIAGYYTDARVRKLYWKHLGVMMGENTYANPGMKVVTGGVSRLIIGNNVSIAPNVVFVLSSCANNGSAINTIPYVRKKLTYAEDIVIEDEVWIGANVTILPGIIVGKCSVIGAGAVVVNDVEPYSVYAGVPARKIRSLKSERERNSNA